jgi:hypothetical protein
MTTLTLCNDTLSMITQWGWLGEFKPAGPYRPLGLSKPTIPEKLDRLLWYGDLTGPLYRNKRQHRAAYRLVHSFSHKGALALGSSIRFRPMFDTLDAPLADVMGILPTVFAIYGFKKEAGGPVVRNVLFRSEHSCPIEQLPEPYGKWLQHELADPKWEKPFNFQVNVRVVLSPRRAGSCEVDLTSSSVFPPLYDHLARELGRFTGQTLQPIRFPLGPDDPAFSWMFD